MQIIGGKRYFRPQEIADNKLITNSKGNGDNQFVLKLIKNGLLDAVQTNVSEIKPYYAVCEEEIERYNQKYNAQYQVPDNVEVKHIKIEDKEA